MSATIVDYPSSTPSMTAAAAAAAPPTLPVIAQHEPIDLGAPAAASTSAPSRAMTAAAVAPLGAMAEDERMGEGAVAAPVQETREADPLKASHSMISPASSATPAIAGKQATTGPAAAASDAPISSPPVAAATAHPATPATPTMTAGLAAALLPSTPPAPPKINIKILVISGQTKVFSFEQETTVGRMKELVWNMWPTEWNKEPSQPESPAYLRVLHLGRILGDEQTLSSLNIPIAPKVTIMHLSVRTFPIGEDEGTKKSLVSTLLRPAGLVTRNSSHNVQAPATANAGNANSATAAANHGRQQGSQRRGRGSGATAAAADGSQGAGASTRANGARQNGGGGDGASHGGGCKCTIM